jgi:predicted amidohydrolase YtcJ
MKATLVVKNAKVVTVDKHFSIQEAVAVDKDRIIAVGDNETIIKLIGPNTQIIDLGGRTMLPGINDSHLHAPCFGATRPPLSLDLTPSNINSIADMVQVLKQEVACTKKGAWIRGVGWNAAMLKECRDDPNRLPRKWELDAVSPDNPVVFMDFSLHTMLVNSKALEIANVHSQTPDPMAGVMERDTDTGEPTGIFHEMGSQELISPHIPQLTWEEKKKAIMTTLTHLNANGITSFTDPAIGPGGKKSLFGFMSEEFLEVYKDLLLNDQLTARVNVLLLLGEYGSLSLADLKNNLGTFSGSDSVDNQWLKFSGVKIFADGIPVTKTSWMKTDDGQPGSGSVVLPGQSETQDMDELTRMIAFAHSKGYQVGVHATGDKAIDVTVDAFLKATREMGGANRRHYVIHGDFISPEKLAILAENDFGLSVQPAIKSQISDYMEEIVGPKRAAYHFPLKTAVDSGVIMSGSSDAPVTYPNWREAVQAAVLRKGAKSGKISGPEQRIGVEDAIRAYTINGAWQDHMEDVKGSIEAGKLADFCVLNEDILSVETEKITNISVVMTIVGGKVVYNTI